MTVLFSTTSPRPRTNTTRVNLQMALKRHRTICLPPLQIANGQALGLSSHA